ncbi:MAG: hypothetical protein IJZ90_00915, partial [Clostridia bacterium]|nr:hypothetical protein [Clostridia bacterium]
EFIAEKGFDPVFGARPLKRAIQTMIEDKIAEVMLSGEYNGKINITVENDAIALKSGADGVKGAAESCANGAGAADCADGKATGITGGNTEGNASGMEGNTNGEE